MAAYPASLGLSAEQVREVIELAAAAPSLHNRRPWQFRVEPDIWELHADFTRRLPHADPDDRELRLACGGALFTVRLALEHVGIRPRVWLAPGDDSTLLAVIEAARRMNPAAEDSALFRAIRARRSHRGPFLPIAVPQAHRHILADAVEAEHCVVRAIDRDRRPALLRLARQAREEQLADAGFRAEMALWTGLRPGTARSTEHPVHDPLVLQDFSTGPHKNGDDEPLILVVCASSTGGRADVQAGQALQRMLLTATSLGLAGAMLSQVVEVARTRDQLRGLLGGKLQPKAVVRIGYATPGSPARRRAATASARG